MRRMFWVGLVLCVGCSSETTTGPTSGCESNGDCAAGEVCNQSECFRICVSDLTCEAGQICESDVCVPGGRSEPRIDTVNGDGALDPDLNTTFNHARRRLTIQGDNLAGSQVTLSSASNNYDLVICSTSEQELIVELPDGIAADTYTLTVTNQAGACMATLPVLQGETGPTGPSGPPGADGVPCAGCVDAASMAAGAVTPNALATGAVTTAAILDGEIVAADIDETSVQRRVTGTCMAGQSVTGVNADGSFQCAAMFEPAWTEVEMDDFEGAIPVSWSQTNTQANCPTGNTILGRWANQTVNRTLTGLPPHTEIRIITDLYIIDTWDDERMNVSLDGIMIYNGVHQHSMSTAPNLCGLMAGNAQDHIRRVDVATPHTATSGTVTFRAQLDSAISDESWGVDNFRIWVR